MPRYARRQLICVFPRIRVDKQVLLRTTDSEPIPVLIENLSFGGACLRKVPESWTSSEPAPLSLLLDTETELLHVVARIAWRQGASLGLAFCELAPDHETRVNAALEVLLSAR